MNWVRIRSMLGNSIGLVVSAGIVVLGIWLVQLDGPDTGPVLCDDEVMRPGDVCYSIRNPESNYTYEEALEGRSTAENPTDEIIGWILIPVGLFFSWGAVLLLKDDVTGTS